MIYLRILWQLIKNAALFLGYWAKELVIRVGIVCLFPLNIIVWLSNKAMVFHRNVWFEFFHIHQRK